MIILNVPYAEKDEAKALGARWDPTIRKWYVATKKDAAPLLKWAMRGDEGMKMLKKAGFEAIKGGRKERAAARRVDRGPAPKRTPVNDSGSHSTVSTHYIELAHDCGPFEACDHCKPTLIASGWMAARESVLRAVTAL